MHGTRGAQHPNCRLREGQVREIYRRANLGEKQVALAAEFKVGQQIISAIKCGTRWRHLGLVRDREEQ